MSVAWGKEDVKYFAKMGIEVEAAHADEPYPWILVAWTLAALFSGFCWYGLYLTAVWTLHTLGVVLSGVPK
jgi:hypothetical protein